MAQLLHKITQIPVRLLFLIQGGFQFVVKPFNLPHPLIIAGDVYKASDKTDDLPVIINRGFIGKNIPLLPPYDILAVR